ncbi:DNA recombination protein RmuC [Parvularcula bermudensis]|nr:DNA recombination protein RmuC [Parvularcula bermudensis]
MSSFWFPLALLLAAIGIAAAVYFRLSVRRGLRERDALRQAYDRCSRERDELLSARDDRDRERSRREEAERREAVLQARLEERERQFQQERDGFEDRFRSLSQRLLREASDGLLREAKANFDQQQLRAKAEAEGYARSVGDLLKPMRETLSRYEQGLKELREDQVKARGHLSGEIQSLAAQTSAVQAEARTLSAALKAGPKTRGRWGETTLRNVVEMTGMSPYCDFDEQFGVVDEDGRRKQPDMVVRLPGERMVAIDSKAPMAEWFTAVESGGDEDRRDAAHAAHAKALWTHVQQLAGKDYAAALKKDDALDFVILFVPAESFFTAAIGARPSLFQEAVEKNIVIATPATLVAILKSIAQSWRQQKAGDNAREVAALARDLYDSLRGTSTYLLQLGKSVAQTVKHYDSLVGNMESRVLPRARRFADYEMPGTDKAIEGVPSLDLQPRIAKSESDEPGSPQRGRLS